MSEFDLTAKISANLTTYQKEIQEEIKKQIDETTKSLTVGLRSHSPRRSGHKLRGSKGGKRYAPGSYARSWRAKITNRSFAVYEKTVYNSAHYRLTHLLEKGHKARNGQRVDPVVHIAPEEKKAIQNYEENIIKRIKSIK